MPATFQQGHALLIGVGADLLNTVDDAEGLKQILIDETRCAYPAEQVMCLTASAARRQAVLDGLDGLAQRADSDATVIVYFSGHGYEVHSDLGAVYFLMPYAYDTARLAQSCIRGDEFAAKLAAIRAQRLVVLLDCCHAGGVGESKAAGRHLVKSPLPAEALTVLSQGAGRVLIASSRADELSYGGRPYSAFTLAIAEALCGVGASRQDGYVRVADLALHAREMVPRRTRDRQHPILHFEHADNFVLASYAGGDPQPKGLPFAVEEVDIEPEAGAWRGIRQQGKHNVVQQGTYNVYIERAHGMAIGDGAQVHNYRQAATSSNPEEDEHNE